MSEDLAAFWHDAEKPDLWALDPARMMADLGMPPDPWQAEFLNSKAQRMLLNCSRQSGKTTTVASLALHTGMFAIEPRTVLVFAPAGRQSDEFLERMHAYYRRLRQPVPRGTDRSSILDFKNGSRIIPLPNNEEAIRGYSADLVIIDEASRVPDILYGAIMPMLAATKGRLVALSTPFGKRGWFWHEWNGEGRTDWVRIRVTADDCPRLAKEEIEQQRLARGDGWVQQEFYCDFSQQEGLVYPGFDACIVDEWPGMVA